VGQWPAVCPAAPGSVALRFGPSVCPSEWPSSPLPPGSDPPEEECRANTSLPLERTPGPRFWSSPKSPLQPDNSRTLPLRPRYTPRNCKGDSVPAVPVLPSV